MIGIGLALKQRTTLAMTPALRQAIGFMAMSNTDLSARLADLVSENPVLDTSASTGPEGWLTLSRQIRPPPPATPRPPPDLISGFGGHDSDRQPQAEPGLMAHVSAQLPLLVRDAGLRQIAQTFLLALEPSGWLGAGLDQIAAEAGCSLVQADEVLALLQGAEPTGLFARSLAECLGLQAAEQGLLTPAFAALLRHLPLLAAGQTEALASACGCPPDEVLSMARALRRLNPKPGAAFSHSVMAGRTADLILTRDGDGWLLELNAQTAPALHLDPAATASPQVLRSARALIQALERRHATVLNIASAIILHQDGFLRGAPTLSALTINDLAAATGTHRSTVSRITSALSLAAPTRTLTLRALLSAPAPAARRQEDPVSVHAVLASMRDIVAAEDPRNPLTDAAIARLLLPGGAALARRTIVKYRALAGIPARPARRRPA